MRYLVIERFAHGPGPVYERFQARGRMLPDGLTYLASWVEASGARCFQLMETADRATLDDWAAHWSDLVDFEIVEVVDGAEAAARFGPRGEGTG